MEPIALGRYLLTERLALGGTAELFKAKLVGVEGFEKTVVVKRILPHWSANASFIAMLVDEAKIMVRLSHERIVQVYELGKDGDTYYIVMEYVHGTDLRRLTEKAQSRNAPLSPPEACRIVAEVLRGLDYIHNKKDEHGYPLHIVHRDISPQNILISTEGAVKIADFGIAHAASRSYETATGVLKGKFTYMSPEQSRGRTIDARTDLFSIGIILYELLTHRRLFAGGGDLEVLERVRNFNVDQTLQRSSLPKPLKEILRRALQANPRERYAGAHEFLKDLYEAERVLGFFSDSKQLANRLEPLMETAEARVSFNMQGLDETPIARTNSIKYSSAVAIVSRPLVPGEVSDSNTDLEETRSLPEFKGDDFLTGNPSSSPPLKKLSKRPSLARWGIFLGIAATVGILIYFHYFSRKPSLTPSPQKMAAGLSPEPMPFTPLPSESEPAPSFVPERPAPLPEKKVEKTKKEVSPTERGNLAVRAIPWGKVSISGIVSGSERPVSRNVPFGNYTVSVTYKNPSGEWKTVSRSVRVAKAATLCTANFRSDGGGSISCN